MKRKIFSILFTLVLVLSFSLVTAAPAQAATINVPGDHATIQAAIDAAGTDDIIIVAAGTYAGFSVSGKDLTISGVGDPVISGTTVTVDSTNALIGVENSTVTIEGLTVDATGLTSVPLAAIFYYHSSGTIKDSTVQNIGDLGQDAGAIWVHGSGGESITILNNTITEFNKSGIWVKDVLSVQIEGNIISTTNYNLAPNGIQVGYVMDPTATTGTVNDNQVSGCRWSGYNPGLGYEASGNWTGSGILVIAPNSTLEISGNEVQSCDVGLDIELGSGSTVTNNEVHDNSYGFVLWNADTVINFNNIYNNALCGVYRTSDTSSTLDATNNWWGDGSGPGPVGPGTGDSVSANVDYDPWLGARIATAETGTAPLDATPEIDVEVIKTGTGTPTITILEYDTNPGTGFSGDIGKYIDVHIDDTTGVTEIEIRLYYTNREIRGLAESSLRLYWWDGSDWTECSDSGVNPADTNGYSGYIWAKIRVDTIPDLDDLTGTPFGGGGNPRIVGGTVYPVDKASILMPWIGLAVALALAGVFMARFARRRVRS